MKGMHANRVQLSAKTLRRGAVSRSKSTGGVVTYAAQAGFNLNKALDKAHETKSLKEIVDLPPSALQGLAEHSDAELHTLNITSVKGLAAWKYYKAAKAIAALAAVEVKIKALFTVDTTLNTGSFHDRRRISFLFRTC